MIYVPDTNALSAYLRGDYPALVARMQQEFLQLRLSVVVVAEREFAFAHGPAAARQRPKFEALLKLIPLESLTLEDARHYVKIRTTLEKKGQGIGPMETLMLRKPSDWAPRWLPGTSGNSNGCLG